MGLDVTTWATAELTAEHERGEGCWDEGHIWAFVLSDDMAPSLAGLTAERCYLVRDGWSFRAGSYGGFGAWRRWLSQMVFGVDPDVIWEDPDNWADHDFGAFRLLINFADNEGTIGPKAAAELAAAFEAFVLPPSDVGYVDRYDTWRKACRHAADGGMLVFH